MLVGGVLKDRFPGNRCAVVLEIIGERAGERVAGARVAGTRVAGARVAGARVSVKVAGSRVEGAIK